MRRIRAHIHFHVFLGLRGRTAPFGPMDVQRVPCKNWRDVHWSFRFAKKYGDTVILVSKTPWVKFPLNPKPTA